MTKTVPSLRELSFQLHLIRPHLCKDWNACSGVVNHTEIQGKSGQVKGELFKSRGRGLCFGKKIPWLGGWGWGEEEGQLEQRLQGRIMFGKFE